MSDKIVDIGEYRANKAKRQQPPDPSRRRVIGLGSAAVLSVVAGASIGEWGRDRRSGILNDQSPKPVTVENTPEGSPEKSRINSLNEILSLKLNDPDRTGKEQKYVTNARSVEDIDLGLEVIAGKDSRRKLLDKRWALRLQGDPELKPLNKDDYNWSFKNHIHPEVLAICVDNYNLWLDTMRIYQEKNVYSKNVDYSKMVITPYGMAMVAQTETGGFINIGKYPAGNEINSDNLSQEYSSYIDVIQSINSRGYLKYVVSNVPGSEDPQSVDSSGGALGPMQLLASSALGVGRELQDNFPPESAVLQVNPFNIRWALLASMILFAEKGYNATDMEKIKKAALSWNNNRSQAEKIVKAAIEDPRFKK